MDKSGFLRSWRWFGPNDAISLEMIRNTPAQAIVTALHHIPTGEIWEVSDIQERKQIVEHHGFTWSVVESLPVHEEIKYQGSNYKKYIEKYKRSLINLGACGLTKICYNFMPVIDWVRTDLNYMWKNKGISMLFNYPTFVVFDVYILKRLHAEKDYTDSLLVKAEKVYQKMTRQEREKLANNIIVVTQGFIHGGVGDVRNYKKAFLDKLELYNDITSDDLRSNLANFLSEILPVAEEQGIMMCLHPDDPPFPVLGLPRIVGSLDDYQWIMEKNHSTSNGITFCTGSLSARRDNDMPSFLHNFIKKVHFAHLRNTTILDEEGSFCESGHLDGGVDMAEVVKLFYLEMKRRHDLGMEHQIPMRPDHGLKLIEDMHIHANPGYPYHGRKKGLEELFMLEKKIS